MSTVSNSSFSPILQKDVSNLLPKHLDRYTDTNVGLVKITTMLQLTESKRLVAVLKESGKESISLLIDGKFKPLVIVNKFHKKAFSDAHIGNMWCSQRADEDAFFVRVEKLIYKFTMASPDSIIARTALMLRLPISVLTSEISVGWKENDLVLSILQDHNKNDDDPIIYPPPAKHLCLSMWSQRSGWIDIVDNLASTCCGMSMATNCSRVVLKKMLNFIPEEAERGEYIVIDLKPNSVPNVVTIGAGRVDGGAIISGDGKNIVFSANYTTSRPITTHPSLFLLSLEADSPIPQRLTQGNQAISSFGWVGEHSIWMTYVDGTDFVTDVIDYKSGEFSNIEPPVVGPINPSIDNMSRAFWVTESAEHYPSLFDASAKSLISLQQSSEFDDMVVEIFSWKTEDTVTCYGYLYRTKSTPKTSPLIVLAHGGPAGAFPAKLSDSADMTRYPVRHLLRAGYFVFQPLYRGTLGFGDEFAAGNIRSQGESDLKDILAGIDFLLKEQRIASEDDLGIFGGSYGGYMTMRAMAKTDRFKCGVAQYGFIHNRWMTYEGGDNTWEAEYIGDTKRWPLNEDMEKSDVFNSLSNIKFPMLLMHGKDDDICPLSQSLVAYRVLKSREIPTGLIIYPDEGHGFDDPGHKRDSCRRLLAWFLHFLPPSTDENEGLEGSLHDHKRE